MADNPSALCFRSDSGRVIYGEDVYVGYRWYDALDIEPLFPFGHGLSYTSFKASDMELASVEEGKITVRAKITNTGSLPGSTVVQAYVTPPAPSPLNATAAHRITRPNKELKGFAKIEVDAGATGSVEVSLDLLRATSYWSEMEDCWRSDAGTYSVLLGFSSRDEFLEQSFVVQKNRTWKGLRA